MTQYAVSAIKVNNILVYKDNTSSCIINEFKNSNIEILPDDNPDMNSLYIDQASFLQNQVIYLNEWMTYKVESLDNDLIFETKDFIKRGTFGNGQFGLLKFKNCTGLSFFKLLKLYIVSPKITEDTFGSMLETVNSFIVNLSFDFNQSTFLSIERDKTLQGDIQYHILLILLHWLETSNKTINLYSTFNLIKNNPHRNISDHYYIEDIGALSYLDEDVVTNIFLNLSNLKENRSIDNRLSMRLQRNGKRYLPQEVLQIEHQDTFDTNENRFLKYFIQIALNILKRFIKLIAPKKDYLINYTLLDRCIRNKKNLESLLNDTFLKNVGELSYIPANSTILHRREGYRQFYNYFITLKSMPKIYLNNDKLSEIIESKNLDVLYEYYCFFMIAIILCDIYDVNFKKLNFKINEDSFSKTLSKKTYYNYFEFVDNLHQLPKIRLYYNKTYSRPESYSKSFDPDISIEVFEQDNRIADVIIFDAKFKVAFIGSEHIGDELHQRTFKYDDISKMHTYKDAINKVLGAYVLYPGDDKEIYHKWLHCEECCNLYCKQRYEGVGAFPLNPNKDSDFLVIKSLLIEILKGKSGCTITQNSTLGRDIV